MSTFNMESYRSGHNEAVLKTVCPKGRVGSNPTLSVTKRKEVLLLAGLLFFSSLVCHFCFFVV